MDAFDFQNPGSVNKFKFWCQKVLPLVYDDSLSYYEVLCKVAAKLNEVIGSNEITAENVAGLYQEYLSVLAASNKASADAEAATTSANRALAETVKSVNGVKPDSNGNIQFNGSGVYSETLMTGGYDEALGAVILGASPFGFECVIYTLQLRSNNALISVPTFPKGDTTAAKYGLPNGDVISYNQTTQLFCTALRSDGAYKLIKIVGYSF